MKNPERNFLAVILGVMLIFTSVSGCSVNLTATDDSPTAIVMTPENTEAQLREIEDEIATTQKELDDAEQVLEEATVENYPETEETVEITDEEEEIYLAELEEDLEDYNQMIEDVETLTSEMEDLLNEYNEALAQTEEFYDDLSESTQQTVDQAHETYDNISASVDEKKLILEEKKTELENMQDLVDLRSEMMIDKAGTMSMDLAKKESFFSSLTGVFDSLKKTTGSNFSQQFTKKYMHKVPGYMAGEKFDGLKIDFNSSFGVPSFGPNVNAIKPGIGR